VEPFGIVFVEALGHGLPVVSSNIGALPDIVQHDSSGYLHEPGDVEAIGRSLELLLGDPERCRQMGETGRAYVRARYTWSAVAAAMAGTIRDSLGVDAS
jgi:glycosyltransferase involved in cell wall biosynthesis